MFRIILKLTKFLGATLAVSITLALILKLSLSTGSTWVVLSCLFLIIGSLAIMVHLAAKDSYCDKCGRKPSLLYIPLVGYILINCPHKNDEH